MIGHKIDITMNFRIVEFYNFTFKIQITWHTIPSLRSFGCFAKEMQVLSFMFRKLGRSNSAILLQVDLNPKVFPQIFPQF